ncbi:MAG: hypothetical protein AUK63_2301 [bacterium P3]|nr:MAG: hypothetical protein AUK63_2301 [bacterium P3]
MKYKIISLKEMPIRQYGVVIEAKANPVEDTGMDMGPFSSMKLFQIPMSECSETISFIIPHTKADLNEMVGWCKAFDRDEELWEVDIDDYFEDYIRLPSMSGKSMERKCRISKRLDDGPLRKIQEIDYTGGERKIGRIQYYYGSKYLGLLRNGKRDGFGFMQDYVTGVMYVGYWEDDIQRYDYEDIMVDLSNKVDGGIGKSFFYEREGIAIGDLYSFEDCQDIVISKTNELYYGLFPKGTQMRSMRGIKIDCHNIKTKGTFNLPIDSDWKTPFVG